jgi:hypothetical protein
LSEDTFNISGTPILAKSSEDKGSRKHIEKINEKNRGEDVQFA